jgi:hypothetical protein
MRPRLTNARLARQRPPAADARGGASDADANLCRVRRSAISAAIVLGAVFAAGTGARAVALYLVLAAIVAVALAALSFFGELVEGSADDDAGAVYVGLSTLALILLVLGAAVRSNTLADQAVPALGLSTLVGALVLLAIQVAVWSSLRVSRYRLVNARHRPAPDV